MYIKRIIVVFVLILNVLTIDQASASETFNESPTVKSLTVSTNSIELTSSNLTLEFSLLVYHPLGIKSNSTNLWLESRDKRIILKTVLSKLSKLDSAGNTVFAGSLSLDPTYPAGLYDFYADPVESVPNIQRNTGTFTSTIYPKPFNSFYDGERSIIVRKAGKLDLDVATFVGPSYSSSVSINDGKPVSFLNESPIFRVGETYNPNDYFVLRVNALKLEIESLTVSVCRAGSGKLFFDSIGFCTFRVYTKANNDYLSKSLTFSVSITSARIKPELFIPYVDNQDVKNLPKVIKTTPVYSTSGAIVGPIIKTPEVCYANIQFITIVGGGKCILNYQSAATNDYLASDLYQLTFDVIKDSQTITFKPVTSADVSAKTLDLAATASSGAAITYSSNSKEICTVEGSKVTLLKAGNCEVTATQGGTPLIASVSAAATIQVTRKVVKTRTITCVKGKKSQKITGVKPKCPKGFKRR